MGKCRYCGEPAGFFSRRHPECAEKYDRIKRDVSESIRSAAARNALDSALQRKIAGAIALEAVSGKMRRRLAIHGLQEAVAAILEDRLLTGEEEQFISGLSGELGMTKRDLEQAGLSMQLVKGAVISDLLQGKLPEGRVNFIGDLPFNFQKKEALIWVFQHVGYLEERTRRVYEGKSSGISVRIARGVYFRTGGFRGEAVDRKETVDKGSGILAVTSKHVYFSGNEASFRIRHDKIVSIQNYADAIEVVKDAARAKPQIFLVDDPWFAFNLVKNANLIE